MKLIVITGGCGFIGANLIKSLLATKESHILVVDNLTSNSLDQLGHITSYHELTDTELEIGGSLQRVRFIKGDIRDQALAMDVCRGAETVVHLAASTGVIQSIQDPLTDCGINIIGTINYLEAARLNGVRRFVFASSSAALGEQVPPYHEKMVAQPKSAYGASKLAGEAYCQAYFASFGLETVILRFGNVYGPHSTHKNSVVAKFIKHIFSQEMLPIYGDGNQTRDFIYVEDLILALRSVLDREQMGGQVFQIATHQEHTVLEVAEELNLLAERVLGYRCSLGFESERAGEIQRSYSDISKAREMLQFEPKYDLKRGLEETFTWFVKHQNE
jgi:UDP-glucose 4-epimerase